MCWLGREIDAKGANQQVTFRAHTVHWVNILHVILLVSIVLRLFFRFGVDPLGHWCWGWSRGHSCAFEGLGVQGDGRGGRGRLHAPVLNRSGGGAGPATGCGVVGVATCGGSGSCRQALIEVPLQPLHRAGHQDTPSPSAIFRLVGCTLTPEKGGKQNLPNFGNKAPEGGKKALWGSSQS